MFAIEKAEFFAQEIFSIHCNGAFYFFCTCFENKGCLVGAATSVIYFIDIHCVFFVTVLLEIHHCLEIVAVRLYFSFQFCLMFEMFLRLATEAASF